MNSMTGFGKAELKTKSAKYTVEISSVNNRYLEIASRLPRQFFMLESNIRDLIKSKLSRGKVNLFVNYEELTGKDCKSVINFDAARLYYTQLNSLKKELGIKETISIKDLILIPEITRSENGAVDDKKIWKELEKVLIKALVELVKMRKKEGDILVRDMKKRIAILDKNVKKIKTLSGKSVDIYRKKLNNRLSELLEKDIPDNVRIEEELAIVAERADISEECTRFLSHLEQYKSTLKSNSAIGKKLNFILQELNREANTIASKCADYSISKIAITVKEEIEKLREQVQNIE